MYVRYVYVFTKHAFDIFFNQQSDWTDTRVVRLTRLLIGQGDALGHILTLLVIS